MTQQFLYFTGTSGGVVAIHRTAVPLAVEKFGDHCRITAGFKDIDRSVLTVNVTDSLADVLELFQEEADVILSVTDG